jgi:hypothetical protein
MARLLARSKQPINKGVLKMTTQSKIIAQLNDQLRQNINLARVIYCEIATFEYVGNYGNLHLTVGINQLGVVTT